MNETRWKGNHPWQRKPANIPDKIHAQRRLANIKLRSAIKSGRIKRPNVCSRCEEHSIHIQGHHFDYTKPLAVVWLCPSCHRRMHQGSLLNPNLNGLNKVGYDKQ